MTDEAQGHSLTDKKGMGGVIAQDGFDYQLWEGLRRVPGWLAKPNFEHIIFEGLEDFEARFFAPHAPEHHLLERFQAKGNDLSPADVREILDGFRAFDERFPCRARIQILVTPRLPSTLQWLRRHTDRVRKARPFYSPFSDIVAVSDMELHDRLISEFGEKLGPFIASSVEISEQMIPDRNNAIQAFGMALQEAFSNLDPRQRDIRAAFEALSDLGHRSRGEPILRSTLVEAIEGGIGERLPLPSSFPLLIRSNRNEMSRGALEIDASRFSGGPDGFPPPERWTEDLANPLRKTAEWLRASGQSRILLDGSYRLSTALVLGHSLRAAHGFELGIPTREGFWNTDVHLGAQAVSDSWNIVMPTTLEDDELGICVGVLRDPSITISQSAGMPQDAILVAHLPKAISSAAEAQGGVALIKENVNQAVALLKPRKIRLFVAGPAAFAVALGHRWNAMPPTQLHEYLADGQCYVPTAEI